MVVHYVAHRSYPAEVVLAEWDQLIELRTRTVGLQREVRRIEMTRDELDWLCRDFVWFRNPLGEPDTLLGFPVTVVEEYSYAR